MPRCRPRHSILSTLHVDTASAETPSDDDVLQYKTADDLWHPEALTPGITSHPLLSDRDQKDHSKYGALEDAAAITGQWTKSLAPIGVTDLLRKQELDTHGAAADPHTVYGALAQAETWTALQTFNASIQIGFGHSIKDFGGTARLTFFGLPTMHVICAGDWLMDRIGLGGVVASDEIGRVYTAGTKAQNQTLLNLTTGLLKLTGNNRTLRGLKGNPVMTIDAASTGHDVMGLEFLGAIAGGGAGTVVDKMIAARPRIGAISFTGTITEVIGLELGSPVWTFSTIVVPNAYGIDIADFGNNAGIVDVDSVRIRDTTLNTGYSRLLEVGGATPNLRVEGRAPAANVSQMLIAVNNGAVVLRRVEIGAANSESAGYRTLRCLN